MKDKNKKKIAPIVISVFILLYAIAYIIGIIAVLTLMEIESVVAIVFGAIIAFVPIVIGAGIVYVLIERIKEINGGEEDEASNY